MFKKKKISQREQTETASQDIVVRPVHLPVVVEKSHAKFSWQRFFVGFLLTLLCIGLWGYVFARIFSAYYDCRPKPRMTLHVVAHRPKHKKDVVAVVGDEEISLEEVRAFVADVPQLAELPFAQVYPNVLEMMINDKVIAKGAKREGIPEEPRIQKMIKMAGDQIIAQAYLAKEMEQVLTEADIRAVYDEEVKNFKPQEEIHARHILVLTEKQAKDILIQLKAGADFGLLADQKSIDKNAPKGDLGYFTKEMMIPEFAEAVFAMKKGELSGPIQTVYGWHIVQVDDRRPTQPPAFDQVKDQMQRLAVEKKVPEIVAAERVRQQVRVLRPTLMPSQAPQTEPEPLPHVEDVQMAPQSGTTHTP